MTEVAIDHRFNGPPESGHGGYTCGLVASALGPAANVRLVAPPPLGEPLTLEDTEFGVRLTHGDTLIAEARPGRPQLQTPVPPAPAAAARAAESYIGFQTHPFPTCFGCGPERAEGDGLRVFPGPAGDDGLLAAPWTPAAGLSSGGAVEPVYVWAALDCPSGFACMEPGAPIVLASMTAELEAPVLPGETYVITAWPLSHDGRKHRAASAIHDAEGRRVAVADTLWITLRR